MAKEMNQNYAWKPWPGTFSAMVVLALGMWLGWWWMLRTLPPEVPLWYSLPVGAAQLGKTQELYWLPLIATVVTVINSLFIFGWRSVMGLFHSIMVWTSFLTIFLLLMAMIHISVMAM